jgi:hypothetical protein
MMNRNAITNTLSHNVIPMITRKLPDFQTPRLSDFQTFRLSDFQTFRLSDSQTSRLPDFQTFRLSDFQTQTSRPPGNYTQLNHVSCNEQIKVKKIQKHLPCNDLLYIFAQYVIICAFVHIFIFIKWIPETSLWVPPEGF